jgi:hypothetical protein
MGDERHANPSYAEDADFMILEYLIYDATKACIEEFKSRDSGQGDPQPGHVVPIQLHILNGRVDPWY